MLLSRRTRQALHLRQFDQINQKDITGLSGHGPRRHQQFIDILTHHAPPDHATPPIMYHWLKT